MTTAIDTSGTDAELDALIRRAESDPAAVDELRRRFPVQYGRIGNLAWQAQQAVVRAFAGEHALGRAALDDAMDALAAELAGPDAPPLERLLAGQVALTWAHVHLAELEAAHRRDGASTAAVTFREQRLGRAQRRYLAAIRSLALVRKHLGPTVVVGQLNVADQQVN